MKVVVLAAALQDMEKSYRFYERQQRGLGTYYRRTVEEDVVVLGETAGIHSRVCGYHHAICSVFKSVIYNDIIAGVAVVFAILDGRIDPGKRDRILRRRR
jgi:hypothetical protein